MANLTGRQVGMGRVFGASLFGDQWRQAARRKEESGGKKERATAGMAGRDAVPPSSGFFDGGRGSREGSLIGEYLLLLAVFY